MEENNTEKRIGEVCIADEVVAVIAGLAATEVEGVDSLGGKLTKELVSRLNFKSTSRGVKVSQRSMSLWNFPSTSSMATIFQR